MAPDSNFVKAAQANLGMIVDNNKNQAELEKQQVLALRDQLNFYFGDSNLCKDKFLQNILKKSSQVPIAVFLEFNRVKEMT